MLKNIKLCRLLIQENVSYHDLNVDSYITQNEHFSDVCFDVNAKMEEERIKEEKLKKEAEEKAKQEQAAKEKTEVSKLRNFGFA